MPTRDRKSTRLNSSHLGISYAVFCLKKKGMHTTLRYPTPPTGSADCPAARSAGARGTRATRVAGPHSTAAETWVLEQKNLFFRAGIPGETLTLPLDDILQL